MQVSADVVEDVDKWRVFQSVSRAKVDEHEVFTCLYFGMNKPLPTNVGNQGLQIKLDLYPVTRVSEPEFEATRQLVNGAIFNVPAFLIRSFIEMQGNMSGDVTRMSL